jgi:hypothetical protein
MNRDDIISMAKKAGAKKTYHRFSGNISYTMLSEDIERFAALVAAAALRERLASWDALERMADNASELGLDYDEPVKEKNMTKAEIIRITQPDAERVLVMRGQKDKVVAIYRENDVDILRTEIKKEDLLSVWKEKP